MKDIENVKLSSTVNIKSYCDWKEKENKKEIVNFIMKRFTERYIAPVKNSKQKSGFAIMALSCLMIEALESFRNGWKNTNGKSKKAFISFFKYAEGNKLKLGIFYKFADDFYKGVRCGLLHQAETTNGWHILGKGKLFNEKTRIVNANNFLEGIEKFLEFY